MQLKTCVHALLHSKKLYHINLMDSNLTLLHHSFIGGTLPEVNDYATSTNFLTLAGQLVTIINNANINNIPQLTLASGEIKGDCVGCLQNYATVNFDNPSVSNLAPQYEWDISFYVSADYNVSGGGGGGSSIDYSNILTSINSNLFNLDSNFKTAFLYSLSNGDLIPMFGKAPGASDVSKNSNRFPDLIENLNSKLNSLVSKNNQSEITQKLSDIFEYIYTDGTLVSSMKASGGNAYSNLHKSNANLPNLLLKLIDCFYFANLSWETDLVPASKPIPKLINISDNSYSIRQSLLETVSSVDVPLLKEIALAISSLASANDNQAIKALKDTISALELKVENNNVLLVDGQQDFCIKDFRELEPNSD